MGNRIINLHGISGSLRPASADYLVRDAFDYARQKHVAETETLSCGSSLQ